MNEPLIRFEEFLKDATPLAQKIQQIGGKLFVVGGCVRDWKYGMEFPKDYDIMVTGISRETFEHHFPEAPFVGDEEDGFPVFLVTIGEMKCELAFARKEKKQMKDGQKVKGYKAFDTYTDPSLTVIDDLIRRDLTINAMAVDVLTNEFIDPHNGMEDMKEGLIRAVSPAFAEDPVRVLRAARFSAQFGFAIEAKTLTFMRSLKDEMATFKPERIFNETKKALKGKQPSRYFQALREIDVLDIHYKEIFDLINLSYNETLKTDCFDYAMSMVDEMAKLTTNLDHRFAALVSSFEKLDSKQKGEVFMQSLCQRLKLPKNWLRAAVFAEEHAKILHTLGEAEGTHIKAIVEAVEGSKRNPLGVEGMKHMALSDLRTQQKTDGEHPYSSLWTQAYEELLQVKANPDLPVKDIANEKKERQMKRFVEIRNEWTIKH